MSFWEHEVNVKKTFVCRLGQVNCGTANTSLLHGSAMTSLAHGHSHLVSPALGMLMFSVWAT